MNYHIKYSLVFFLLIISFGCKKVENESKVSIETNKSTAIINETITVSTEQFQSEKMQLIKTQEHPFPSLIRTTGMIDVPPSSKAVISAYIGGYIKKSLLLIGDKVKKGQPLVTIENLEFIQMQQDFLEISEQLIYLKSEYERQKVLFNEKISSKKSYLKAQSEYKKINAQYNGLHKKLKLLNINPNLVGKGEFTSLSTIYAPISGSITDVSISTGSYISPADQIMEIVNTEHIHIELRVFEKDVLKIKKGQKVIFRLPESSDQNFMGTIHLIGKSIDENRTIKVHAHMDENIAQNFIVGMFVESDIVIQDKLSKALPEKALVDVNDQKFILILKSKNKDNYIFTKKKIEIGATYNGYTELINSNSIKENQMFLSGDYNLITEE
ncbi:MAG: efflux RND transporter periplasmic adaptor subunit [Flavobacteriaceae bacterium]|nr:efflux RND transporter periplasmic adaptor subunit [Flavobacteriaceae bacterium]